MCIQVQYIKKIYTLTIHRHVIFVVIMMLYDMQYINKHLTKSTYIYISPSAYPHTACDIPIKCPAELPERAQGPVLNNRSAALLSCADAIGGIISQSKNQNKNMKHHETRHVWCLCLEIVPKIRKMSWKFAQLQLSESLRMGVKTNTSN